MSKSKVQHISAKEAHELIQREPAAAFIDVRSDMEYLFIGHPVGAVNIPWIDEPDFVINPNFEREVRKLILGGVIQSEGHDSVPEVLICRSGRRSQEAGRKLLEAGMSNIYHVSSGFEGPLDDKHHRSTTSGWRFEGLPWQQC